MSLEDSVLPPPTKRWPLLKYKIGLWALKRWCAKERHWLAKPITHTVMVHGQAVTFRARRCRLCGCYRAQASDMHG